MFVFFILNVSGDILFIIKDLIFSHKNNKTLQCIYLFRSKCIFLSTHNVVEQIFKYRNDKILEFQMSISEIDVSARIFGKYFDRNSLPIA